MRQLVQQGDEGMTIVQIPARQFTNDHRVHQYLAMIKKCDEPRICRTQMIYPDRGINQYHDNQLTGFDRLRGIDSSAGSEPPRRASLRALSRSINAFRLSRNKAVFSEIPVSSTACSYSKSSMFNVVRIGQSPEAHQNIHHYMHIMMLLTTRTKQGDSQ